MIQSLDYSVTFPTGRTLNEAVLFQGGFGAIVGPNESGKSMIVEMIRFCLFGSSALRGRAEDYKTLKAKLSFGMKGNQYVVDRTQNKAQLTKNGEIVATGTKPVNLKLIQEIGFGLAVFDMSCVANQNQLLELGDMPPADRRRAVDSVIGVSVLDDLAKHASDEALALKRAADDLNDTVREPVAPHQPDGYRPSTELELEKEALDLVRSRADQLRGWLSNIKKRPVAPACRIELASDSLQDLLDAQNSRKLERQGLEAELARIPEAANVTLEEIEDDEKAEEQHRLYLARRQFLTFHPRPDHSQENIDELRTWWEAYRRWQKLQHLRTQQADLIAKGEHVCPSCDHHWPIAGSALETVDAEIEALTAQRVDDQKPPVSETEIDTQQRKLDGWDEAEWQKHLNSPDKPTEFRWTVQDRIRHKHGLEGKARRAELLAQIEQLKPAEKEPDYAGMLRERQQYEAQLSVYSGQLVEFEAWEAERNQKQTELTLLEFDLQSYPDLIQALHQARIFESAQAVFDKQLADYQQVKDTITTYRTDAEDWVKVKEALRLLRLRIKQYLIPSLNKVASVLISQMTGGQRQSIAVDEDFNILVDNQAINTLSGSGKAVANLALRLGLGQVLTNNIFSLFMGDEIDESMDKERAEKTARVLHTLKGRISQLLLVSHKSPAADYYIAVGDQLESRIATH